MQNNYKTFQEWFMSFIPLYIFKINNRSCNIYLLKIMVRRYI